MKKKLKEYFVYKKNCRLIKRELMKAAISVLTAINETAKMPNPSEQAAQNKS